MAPAFKDHFSSESDAYKEFRPGYPQELFRCLSSIAPARDLAWDCATGSGQAAAGLAGYFSRVMATDASQNQLANAVQHDRISYRVEPAECTSIADDSVDLITVAQALHWFNLPAFEKEVARVLGKRGVLAVWSYGLMQVSADVDAIIYRLYEHTLGACWPPERKIVENGYSDISFSFDELEAPEFVMQDQWSSDQLIGYLSTWSAAKRFRKQTGIDAVDQIKAELKAVWGDTTRMVRWPLVLRLWSG